MHHYSFEICLKHRFDKKAGQMSFLIVVEKWYDKLQKRNGECLLSFMGV